MDVLRLLTFRICGRCSLLFAGAVFCLGGCDPQQLDGREQASDAATQFGQLRLGAVLGETDGKGFARAERVRAFTFPADHGPHERFRSEWWYLTVVLADEFGAEFGVQFTVFRQALDVDEKSANPWVSSQVYMAHAAVTAVREQRHWEAQRVARDHPRLAGARAAPFRVWVDGWSLAARNPRNPLPPPAGGFAQQRLDVSADDFRVALDLDMVKAPVLQGDRGLSAKGPEQASYYYSVPRMGARGTVWIGEVPHEVHGSAWFDREWSTSVLSGGQVGWDWFALQLDDSTELMAFRLRRDDGKRDPFDQGLQVDVTGVGTHLTARDFTLDPEIFWVDDRGVSWPLQWRLALGERVLRIRAAVPDQRMDTAIVYWEGLVGVFEESGERIGKGYMELTGY